MAKSKLKVAIQFGTYRSSLLKTCLAATGLMILGSTRVCGQTATVEWVKQLTPLMDAVSLVESGNDDSAIGDAGKALGKLQIHVGVVLDVNRHFGTSFVHTDALNPKMAETLFYFYLSIWATEKHLGRPPTLKDCALIWHLGPNATRWQKNPKAKAYLAKVVNALRGTSASFPIPRHIDELPFGG